MTDSVNHPPHYNAHPSGVECIELTEAMGCSLGNAFKYIWRHKTKGKPLEDLKKAKWYLQREMDKRKKDRAPSRELIDKFSETETDDTLLALITMLYQVAHGISGDVTLQQATAILDGLINKVADSEAEHEGQS